MRALDDFLPVYEFSERHSIAIDAPTARIYAAFRAVWISDIPVARALWWLRRLGRPYGDSSKPFVGGELLGVVLGDVSGEGIVLGLTGHLWRTLGGQRDSPRPTTAEEFLAYDRPDACKAVVDFRGGPRLALHGDSRPRLRSRRPSQVSPLLAGDQAVQRPHPHPAPASCAPEGGGVTDVRDRSTIIRRLGAVHT
jgi:hypothetical protein